MHINRFKSAITLLVATAVLILIYPMPLFAVDPLNNFVDISCTGSVPSVEPSILTIGSHGPVDFIMNTNTCDVVVINGDYPIGNFKLRDSNPIQTITFLNDGAFTYSVTDSVSDTTLFNCKVIVAKRYPTLSSWGMIILVTLIIITSVYLWLRRKPSTV